MSTVVSAASHKHRRDDDLWQSAHKKWKNDPDSKYDKFQKAIRAESESKGISSSGHLSSHRGMQDLLKFINNEASAMKPHNGTYDKVVQAILKTKDIVSTGAAASPPAAIAVAGIFMVFSIQQTYRREEEAACAVVARIANIIARRAPEENECYKKIGDKKAISELREQLYFSYQSLYFALLSAISRIVCWLRKPKGQRFLDSTLGRADWAAEEQNLRDLNTECTDILEDIHRNNANPAGKESPWVGGRNRLHQSAAMGDYSRVQGLIEDYAFDPNETTKKGWSALGLAAESGELKTCQILLAYKRIDVESQNNRGRTALHIAAMKDRGAVVQELIKKGKAKLNVQDKDGKTPLHLAAEAGRLNIVKILCKFSSIQLDLTDKQGRTALHLAALKQKAAVTRLLAEKGAAVDHQDDKGHTAFLDAAEAAKPELVKILHEHGADVNQQTSKHKWSALHFSAKSDNSKCVKALSAMPGIDLNKKNDEGLTPLHLAVLRSRTRNAVALVDKGAKIDTRDKAKRTPFLDAAKLGNLEVVKKLRGKGADVNQVSGARKWSALHEAAGSDYIDIAKYLVSEGINLDLRVGGGPRKGMTAKEVAENRKSKDVLEFLALCEEERTVRE